jgi:hypothetical protein
MKKSALTAFIKEEILGTLNESPSTEEIRMAKQAIARFMKYRNVGQDEAIRDLENALDALKQLEEASDEEIQNQKEFNDELEKTNALMSKMAMEEEEDAPAGDTEVEKKVSKQDKIIKDFQRIEKQMKTHLELFKTSESPENKETAKNMLKKLTPEYQAAKKAYDEVRNVKV